MLLFSHVTCYCCTHTTNLMQNIWNSAFILGEFFYLFFFPLISFYGNRVHIIELSTLNMDKSLNVCTRKLNAKVINKRSKYLLLLLQFTTQTHRNRLAPTSTISAIAMLQARFIFCSHFWSVW